MIIGNPTMRSRSTLPLCFIATVLVAALAVCAFAQTTPAQTPAARKDRLFLKDVEGIWINEAYLSVLAASKRPDLVRGVVLLDSPLLTGLLARAVQIGKPLGLVKRYSPGHVSRRRRQHWPSAEAAFSHFAAKPMFARWQPDVLRDYIACGLQPDANGHTLAFRREIETAIYNTLPHHLGRLLRVHPLPCAVAFIGGTESAEVRRVGMRATQRLTHGQVSWIAGSHLFPFEKPAQTAAEVLRWLTQFSAAAKVGGTGLVPQAHA